MAGACQRGLGYRHRPPTLLARAGSALRRVRVPADFEPTVHPPFAELFHRFGPLDQGPLNACTGFGVAMGATIQSAAGGRAYRRALSPLLPYWAARRREVGSDELVRDEGAYVDDVVWAFNAFGSFEGGDLDMARVQVNDRPPPCDFRAALRERSRLQLRLRQIVDEPVRLLQRIAHSLHLGQVCFLALPVGASFFEPPLGAIPAQRGEIAGYHFVCVLDWYRFGGGLFELLCGNSWGSWANGGTAWLSPELCMQSLGAWYLEHMPALEASS